MKEINKAMLPKEEKKGYRGYYPVMSSEEYNELPEVYKWMDWLPVKVRSCRQWDGTFKDEITTVDTVIFDVVYMMPYKISAKVEVHRDDVAKILFCSFKETQCHLYSISQVKFKNGEIRGAKWLQDTRTGSYGIVADGMTVGIQGGYGGYIPKGVSFDGKTFGYNQNRDYNSKTVSLRWYNPFD